MKSGKHLKGIHVDHCKNTAGTVIIPMTIPNKVAIAMSQCIGAPCTPTVKVGDHVLLGQLIGDSDAAMSVPVHSSVSGKVVSIEKRFNMAGKPDTFVVIEADGRQDAAEDLVPPQINSREDFLKAVRNAGLVGLGGASFPTHIKYNPKNPDEIDTLVINGAECEPYITVDHAVMVANAEDIIAGAKSIMKWLNIPKTIIGIESNKPDAIAVMEELTKGDDSIKIHTLRNIYPQGAERVIIYESTGRHLVAGKLPADVGVIVSNVTTVLKLQQYLKTGLPLVTKSLTVDGNAVANPKNVEVPIGTSIHDIIEFCGGAKKDIRKILLGGPMMGKAAPNDEVCISKGNNAVLVFDDDYAQRNKETACISCGRCVRGCPMNLMPTVLSKAFKDKDIELLEEYNVMTCMDCGCCAYNCPARKPLNSEFRQAKALVMEARKKGGK